MVYKLYKVKQNYINAFYLAELDEERNLVHSHDLVDGLSSLRDNIVLKISEDRLCTVKLFSDFEKITCAKVLINNRVGWANSFIIEEL